MQVLLVAELNDVFLKEKHSRRGLLLVLLSPYRSTDCSPPGRVLCANSTAVAAKHNKGNTRQTATQQQHKMVRPHARLLVAECSPGANTPHEPTISYHSPRQDAAPAMRSDSSY